MKRDALLVMLLSLFLAIAAGCNGIALNAPNSNPLPGGGADNPSPDDKINGNYAIDIIPERIIPPSLPVDDPDWRPTFGCLTDTPTCIDEGCIEFTVENLDLENLKVDFNATFFNWNAENFNALTVFLVVTSTTVGVESLNPDGMIKLDEKDTIEYPYYAFSNDNNPGDNEIPGTMYCYFERDISFSLEVGCDFCVTYVLMPVIDQHDLSYNIDLPGRAVDPGANTGDDHRSGSREEDGQPTSPPTGQNNNHNDDDDDDNTPPVNVNPPLKKPGN